MAEESGAEGGAEVAPKKPRNPQLMLILANTLLVLAAMGTLVYTKILYKKPVITEEGELEKKQEELKTQPAPDERPLVNLEQLLVNIAMTSGKSHYATVALTIECRDQAVVDLVNAKKDIIKDKLISSLGKRQMTELNTIQGKLILKSQLMREFNEVIGSPGITNLYFSSFILQ